MTKAEELFAASFHLSRVRSEIEESIDDILGSEVLYERFTFDPYDNSFELKEAAADLRFTDEEWKKLLALGFDRVWICHVNGMETHYPGGAHRQGYKAQ